MAAIEGFVPSIATGDLAVTSGMVDGVHVAASAGLDGAALSDGTAYAVVRSGSLVLIQAGAQVAGDVVVASCTITSGVCSAPVYTGRGVDPVASANA